MGNYARRLPIYLLLDCSESMAGEAFSAMKDGLVALIGELRADPMALETVFLSVITFATSSRQLVPLTEIIRFQPPPLSIGSGTALGAALRLWQQCIEREVIKTSVDQKGDYKPICFILTDGSPTDDWEAQADHVRTTVCGKKANIIGVALGPDADTSALKRVTGTVLMMHDPSGTPFKRFFQWVSASISMASAKLEGAGEKGMGLPQLPAELQIATQDRAPQISDRYVFLHARCCATGNSYVIRYQRDAHDRSPAAIYHGVASHPVDNFDLEGRRGADQPEIESSRLQNPPGCPYCDNPQWGKCRAGHIHCCPALEPGGISLTCPWCHATEIYTPQFMKVGSGVG